jgi:hypothetical protein
MLVNHADAVPDGVAGGGEVGQTAVYEDLAFFGFVKAVKDVHEGGFSSPVFAQEGVNLALADQEVHLVVGDNTGESLDDSSHFNCKFGHFMVGG